MASRERTLADAIEAALEAETYISANSIPVLNWDDQTALKTLPCVTVRVAPRERVSPNHNFYRMAVEIVCHRYRGDDVNQAVQDPLYDEVAVWANGVSAASLALDGKVNQSGIEDTDEKIHMIGVAFDAYDTIA